MPGDGGRAVAVRQGNVQNNLEGEQNVKRSLTIAVIAVLAVGLVVGSVYVVLRPEEEHRQA